MNKLELRRDLASSGQFLANLVKITYYKIILSLSAVRNQQSKNGAAAKEMHEINGLLKVLSHTDDTKITYTNGFHVNSAITKLQNVSLQFNATRPDYPNFFRSNQPVIDEQALHPSEFTLIQGIYNKTQLWQKSYRKRSPFLGWVAPRDFSFLDMRLFNVEYDLRKYIQANITGEEESCINYAQSRLNYDPF